MSLKDLIKKHHPKGAEYKSIEEISKEIIRGNGIKKQHLKQGSIPFIPYPDIYTKYEIWFDDCKTQIGEVDQNKKKYCTKGDILIAEVSNVIGNIGKACAYLGNEKCLIGGNVIVIKHDQNPKYLSYALSTESATKQKWKYASSGSATQLITRGIKRIKIPIPHIEIQERIASILDLFRELEKELKLELILRKKQYEFYIDKLIKKYRNECKTIEDIATEITGASNIKKDLLSSEGYPCVIYGQIYTKYDVWFDECISKVDEELIRNKKYCHKGDLIITASGETKEDIGKTCAYLGNKQCLVGGSAKIIRHNQNPKYLSYAFSSSFVIKQKLKYSKVGAITNLTTESLKKIKIPLPNLKIQEQIAEQLDKFRSLCNAAKEGIPKEIELNKRRYEYYRDKLISLDV